MEKNPDICFDLNSVEEVGLYDELPFWSSPFGLKLLDQVRLKKNITALDIGFGTGFPLTELAMRLGKTCTVYGIDPWEAAIKRTEDKLNLYRIENVRIIRGIAEDLPLGDRTVDLIVSNNGINNVSDLNRVLSECSRVIKGGGQFVLSMNLNSTMMEFYSVLEQVLTRLELHEELKKVAEHIYSKRRPLPEITGLLELHGFAINNIVEDRFEYRFTDGTTLFEHYFIRLAFLPAWKDILPEDRREVIFNQIESMLNDQSDRNGFCKLSVPFVVIDCGKKI